MEALEYIDRGRHVVVPNKVSARGRNEIEVSAEANQVFALEPDGQVSRVAMYQELEEALAVGGDPNVNTCAKAAPRLCLRRPQHAPLVFVRRCLTCRHAHLRSSGTNSTALIHFLPRKQPFRDRQAPQGLQPRPRRWPYVPFVRMVRAGAGHEQSFEELIDVCCPECARMQSIVWYPTSEETRAAAAAGTRERQEWPQSRCTRRSTSSASRRIWSSGRKPTRGYRLADPAGY